MVYELPEYYTFIWQSFVELSFRRSQGMAGIAPISYNDIDCYCRLYSISFESWELEALIFIDNEWVSLHNKDAAKKTTE